MLRSVLMTLMLVCATASSAAAQNYREAEVANQANLEVRLTAMEEEMRRLRGALEESQFQNRRLQETLDKFQKDAEFRFGALEHPQAAATSPAAGDKAKPAEKPMEKPPTPAGPTTAGDGTLRLPGEETPPPGKEFAAPRDHYNHAFKLLNQTRYDEAAKYFKSFIDQYPQDPLIGNAHYWLGETQYIRREYARAADEFRAGFEALPNGPKAPDNLLKLAMSLDALKRDADACVVLDQIVSKYAGSARNVVQKAEQERGRMGCK